MVRLFIPEVVQRTIDAMTSTIVRRVDFENLQNSLDSVAQIEGLNPVDGTDHNIFNVDTVVVGDQTNTGVAPLTLPTNGIIIGKTNGVDAEQIQQGHLLTVGPNNVQSRDSNFFTLPLFVALRI